MTRINLINTNARPLKPKVVSLLDCVKELDSDVAIVTETWLRDEAAEELAQELSLGSGLNVLTKNRAPLENGVAYGGVAIICREDLGRIEEVKIKNPQNFEVLVAAASLKGHSRKFVVVACYLPPGYSKF